MISDLLFIKTWWQSKSRNEHIPSSLAECLDTPSSSRREAWRFWLIILLILPTLYYINDLLIYEKFRFLNRGPKRDDIVSKRPSRDSRVLNTIVIKNTAVFMNEATTRDPSIKLPICVVNKSELGKFSVRCPQKKVFLANQYPMISKGGYYSPVGCQSRHKVAILVPYRNREENLSVFMYNIHPFLMKQKLEYRIFLVEQKGADKFNKGRLFNAGFEELKKYGSWHCIVFHDVDLIPLDERILYSCPSWPRHMCASVVQQVYSYNASGFVFSPTYQSMFGGVTSMTPAQYETVNGYSNLYWGWGGEDQDMFWRLRHAGLQMTRYSRTIAKYMSLPHPTSAPNPLRYLLLHDGPAKYRQEGLSTLEYKLVSVTERPLYTHIVVDINPARKINSNPI